MAEAAHSWAETGNQRDLIEHVVATSDPELRAVFAEDSAALIGLVIPAAGLAAHQLTGSSVPDAAGSILVGMLLAVIAVVLINRNRRFLVGDVDLTGDDTESHLAVRLRAVEAKICTSPLVVGAVLSLSAPESRRSAHGPANMTARAVS